MAQACPSVILDVVLKKLGSPIFQKIKFNCCLRIQLGDLRSKLELLGEVIDDAEGMAVLFPKFVREWVCDLQRVLFELDDILDEALMRSTPAPAAVAQKVRPRLYSLPFDLMVVRKMKEINNRLTGIVKECCRCNLIVDHQPGNQNQKPVARKGILRYDPDYVKDDEFCMIGRDDDKKEITRRLLDEDPSKPALWILGDSGVGKTTLCRAVYNDEDVKNRFELRLWIGFAGLGDFSPREFWKKIITKIREADDARAAQTDAEEEEETEVQLKDEVTNLIGMRKTLLVVDNFPSHDILVFQFDTELLCYLIAAGKEGSKILISLRNHTSLWNILVDPYTVEYDLSKEHCLSIFKNIAFVPRHDRAEQPPPPPEWMTDLAKQIVSKCDSHPALLRGVGTLLYGKEDRATWEYFARDYEFNHHAICYSTYFRAFKCLTKCQYYVGYLSLFIDHEFKFEALIQQFTAHGFTDFSKDMQQCFHRRFLVSVSTNEDNWDTKGMSEFNIVKVNKEAFMELVGAENAFLEWTGTNFPEEARHVSFARPPSSSSEDQSRQDRILPHSLIKDAIHRRSLLFLGELFPVRMSAQTLGTLASNLRYLRVLDLQDMALQVLPTSVGKLIHLRYLDLSRNDFRVLPRTICRLKNLLTLKLIYCDKLIKLPRSIKKLGLLKHLEINMCLDLTDMPPVIARMTCLERLDRFIVSPHSGGLGYLEHLNSLSGDLSIEFPRRWERSKADAEQANLERKIGLTSLEFKWQGSDDGAGKNNDDDDVLEKLKPCSGTENLSILNFGGEKFPSWIASLGSCLTEIIISRCKRCETLPSFHAMPNLKVLTLTSLNIEYVQVDSVLLDAGGGIDVFFPSLDELNIGRMPRLKGWWDLGLNGFPNIATNLPRFPEMGSIEIWNCPCLTMMPPFSCVGSMILQDVSNKMLQSMEWEDISTLKIISIQDMVSLPNKMLDTNQACLVIEGCNSLQTIDEDEDEGEMEHQGVCILTVTNCPAMKRLSGTLRHLSYLKGLTISTCSEELDCLYEEEENGMPWKALQYLCHLTIGGFQNLVALPKGLRHLQYSLSTLFITNCPAMKHVSRSLRDLIHLEELSITNCSEELDCLYKEDDDGMPWNALQRLTKLDIGGFENLVALPKGLGQLRSLRSVSIRDCKALRWEFGSLPKLCSLTVSSCPHLSARIKELEMELRCVEVLE